MGIVSLFRFGGGFLVFHFYNYVFWSFIIQYKQATDVIGQRLKVLTLADQTQDWNKAPRMALVPDDEVNVIVGAGDLRLVAKELELKHKLAVATQQTKQPWSGQKGERPSER